MTDSKVLELEPGLYFDEGVRTLPEVTLNVFEWAGETGWEADPEAHNIVEHYIVQCSHSGIWHWKEGTEEIGHSLYEELCDHINEHLPEGLWFGYLNEGGGWGIWQNEEEDW